MATAANLLAPLTFKSWLPNGTPNAFGTVATYSAGTVTPIATFVDSTGTTTNTNPVPLNARGEASIWVTPNVGYKFVEADSLGNQIKVTDQVIQNQLVTLYGGTDTGAVNAYILTFAASFTSLSNGIVLYWLPANTNTGASTLNVNGLGVTPIVNPNGSALGPNQIIANQMTSVVYSQGNWVLSSIAGFTGPLIGVFGTETSIPSAATTDLGTAVAHVAQITGTTTITSFGSSANVSAPIYCVRFTGALTLTYNPATLLLPNNANIITTAGDALIAEYLGVGAWKVLLYQYAAGSTNTKIKPGDTVQTSNATLTADPDLQSNMLGVGRYSFEIYLDFDSVAAGAGFKWTNGGTAVDSRGVVPALASGWVNTAAYGPKADTFYGTTITYATVATGANANQVLYKGSMLVSTAGTLGVSWAQNSSTGSATTLRAGSYLTTVLLNTGTSVGQTQRVYNSGSGTETIPTGYNTLILEVWAGGGGGGGWDTINGGGGGGAGGYSRSTLTVTGQAGNTMTYTVGAGGASGFSGSTSSVTAGTFAMTTMTTNGGATGGNASGSPGAGGVGGTAVGGTIANTTGTTGSAGNTGGGGGRGGPGTSGVYGSAGNGGKGQGNVGAAQTGGNGQIIFTYSV